MRRSRFERLAREHVGAVTAYARALTNDRWLADDAVQETFLRAWKYQDSFRGDGSYQGWLLRICRNAVVDQARRPGSERFDVLDEDRAGVGDHEDVIDLDHLLQSLPVAQREVLTLCGVLGYDYETAADLLDVPVGTVRSRLSRARAGLAACLEASRAAGAA
ncbi:MAG: RNA polymerase sigma factor [Acidimicrobiales bacterium]